MTEQRPAWYGGNKIPDSYLKKFRPSQDDAQDELPLELRLFVDQLGPNKKPGAMAGLLDRSGGGA